MLPKTGRTASGKGSCQRSAFSRQVEVFRLPCSVFRGTCFQLVDRVSDSISSQ